MPLLNILEAIFMLGIFVCSFFNFTFTNDSVVFRVGKFLPFKNVATILCLLKFSISYIN